MKPYIAIKIIWPALYYTLTYIRTVLVTISETIPGDQSILSPLLTKHWLCRKSSMNISVDNRYCSRFIHIYRPIFNVNRSGVPVFNSDHICKRACTHRFYTRETPVTQSATRVELSRQNSSIPLLFRVPTHYVSNTLFTTTVQPTLLVKTQLQSIKSAWKNDFFNIRDQQQSAIFSWSQSHKVFITIYFYIWA